MARTTITRRQFLRIAGSIAGVSLLASCAPSTAPTSAPKPSGATQAPPAAAAKEVKLVVWTQSGTMDNLRADNAVPAAKLLNDALSGKNIKVTVEPVVDSASWGDYKKKYTLAADAGQAPDIAVAGHEDSAVWASAGYIAPLDDCIKSQKEYEDIIPGLWSSTIFQGKRFGIPCDTEARPMFFSITKLKALGWSDAQVAELPKKIEKGEFTLDDMIATGKEAISKGVIEKGFGYWHRTSKGGDFLQYYYQYGGRFYDEKSGKMVVNKAALKEFYNFQRRVVTEGVTPANFIGTQGNVWHDTVSNGKALFFNGGVWNWSDWAANYAGKTQGGRPFLEKTIGYALEPTGIKGKPGAQLSHPLLYFVSSKKATSKDTLDLACQLLAKISTTALANAHSLRSTHLAILKSQLDSAEYKAEPMLSGTAYMVNFAFYQPNHAQYGVWWDTIYAGMEAVENGAKTTDQAIAEALQKLQADMADQLIVE